MDCHGPPLAPPTGPTAMFLTQITGWTPCGIDGRLLFPVQVFLDPGDGARTCAQKPAHTQSWDEDALCAAGGACPPSVTVTHLTVTGLMYKLTAPT